MSTELAKQAQAYMEPVVDVQQAQPLPYVTFAFKMGDKWDDMVDQIKGLQEGTPVLNEGGEYTRLIPFKFHLVSAKQLWVERKNGREPLSVLTQRPSNWKVPQKEEIHAVVLAYVDGEIVPASVTFKKAICKGPLRASRELETVSGRDPTKLSEWMAKSDDHRAAASITLPFARFTVSLTTQIVPPKGNGEPYPESVVSLTPTTFADAKLVENFLANGGIAQMDKVTDFLNQRIQELLALEITK